MMNQYTSNEVSLPYVQQTNFSKYNPGLMGCHSLVKKVYSKSNLNTALKKCIKTALKQVVCCNNSEVSKFKRKKKKKWNSCLYQ